MLARNYRIRGVAPLIMHNEQLSDPLNKWTKELARITSKRKKTEADHAESARLEWYGGLYQEDGVIAIPERCIERMLRDGAAQSREGKKVQAGLIVMDPAPLEYNGPKNIDKLWESGSYMLRASVGVQGKRVIRTRPWFPDWSLSFAVHYDENVLNASSIDQFVEVAGRLVGLLDWRPKHGRFVLESATDATA